jgi:hypothetical protein
MSKPWQTKEWIEKRKHFIEGKKCEKCGSTTDLVIHHKKKIAELLEHKRKITNQLVQQLIKKGEFKPKIQNIPTCPKCKTHRKSDIKERKRTKPSHKHLKRFRCKNCKHEFEKPVYRKKKTNRLSKRDWERFLATYEIVVDNLVSKQRKEFHKYYMSFKDTQILCKRCHYADHKGMKLCAFCKKRYHEKKWDMCFICYTTSS